MCSVRVHTLDGPVNKTFDHGTAEMLGGVRQVVFRYLVGRAAERTREQLGV